VEKTIDKIVCVGKNYAAHAKELGDAVPERPVLFLKPPSVLRQTHGDHLDLKFPEGVGSVHHECEIVLKVGEHGAIAGVTLGLDMTLRDRQAEQKKNGHPWTTSKVFRDSAVAGPWVTPKAFPNYLETEFIFSIDGVVKQKGMGNQMIYSPEKCLAYIQEFFPLLPGDLVYTGTPAGVGPVLAGQKGNLQWGPIAFDVIWK